MRSEVKWGNWSQPVVRHPVQRQRGVALDFYRTVGAADRGILQRDNVSRQDCIGFFNHCASKSQPIKNNIFAVGLQSI